MREPSERLYSYYLWSCSFKYGNNTDTWPTKMREDPAGNFHAEVSQAVTDFDNCPKTNSLYECANRYTFTNGTKVTKYCGQLGFRLVVSIYYIHIAKFLQFFSIETISLPQNGGHVTESCQIHESRDRFVRVDTVASLEDTRSTGQKGQQAEGGH